MAPPIRIGLIGDLHGAWDDWDAQYFSASDYDLLLFTGDLGSGTLDNGIRIARSMGRLSKAAYVMLGNNDVKQAPHIAAELTHQRGLHQVLLVAAQLGVGGALAQGSGSVQLAGFSRHELELRGRPLTLIGARPHAMGGDELSFPERLAAMYGVRSMGESTERLCGLIDQAQSDDLLLLAHNGPRGLGSSALDLWGCDFRPEAGDFGDSDLSAAVRFAKQRGKRVLAVIAGHMHSPTRVGAARVFQHRRDGSLFINPARVPRIFDSGEGPRRHHAVLTIDDQGVRAEEVFVDEEG